MFSRLVDVYKNRIFALSYKFTNDYNEAQDLSQEIFIKIFNNIGTFRFEASPSTWIYKIATNICIDYNRKKKRQKFKLNEDISQGSLSGVEIKSKDGSPEDIVISDEKQREVHKVIYKLPDIYKSVIIMYHFNELSYKEIAKVLDIPEKTVETRLYRARRMLRDKLLEKRTGGEIGWNVEKL
ncbi:sigma-70 family RNA polymerase sigma factor [Wukongibacter baidiensis]|uniref:RNA polymerase sigma factor n=1 Tax=Wukongibacter baidiensis TaxID=1723361 RepID=UPI003D7F7D5B